MSIFFFVVAVFFILFCVRSSLRIKELQAVNAELLSQMNADRQKERESEKNSSLAISKSRALLAEEQRRSKELGATLRMTRQSLIALPLPGDMTSAGGRSLIYLPRFTYRGKGIAEVIIPGTYCHFPLHMLTEQQTEGEREAIYETLRESGAAQQELALRLLWNFTD